MKRVVAVVVTYNRLALLKDCLAAIETQSRPVDAAIVVNNASTDGTSEFLSSWGSGQPTHRSVVELPQNTGGAGGFTLAIKKAYDQGAEWIWIMDDDSVPARDCLETLLASEGLENVGFLAPLVRWKDGSPCLPNAAQAEPVLWSERYSSDRPLVRILSATFVGLLLHRRAIDAVGFPVPQFFIWYDDIEYTLRITKVLSAYCVPAATVVHMIAENAVPDFSRVSEKTLWKHQFGIRNETSVVYRTRRFGLYRAFSLWVQRNREMRQGGVGARLRMSVLWWGIRGLGFAYPQWIEHPQQARRS